MNATRRFLPSASSPSWVDGPSARTEPSVTTSPISTRGFWLMQVPWFDRRNFDPGADERRGGTEERDGLALHVGAHQRAVRVVVLEERDERRRHRNDLLR